LDDITGTLIFFVSYHRVTNIAATALVTDAATALFGEAGVTAATGVMTVSISS
jgi:Mg2+/Co2+ transporter CorB